ncbi:translation initiation factor IF-3 [Candidatus Kuenenbacteria bacterium HGW-Kuenenbacteria-1]|uniref:Translation initiation factor IF-3 n=1 Tax=Candidatus Kuenenbacteria bacterium HGW-Kuenenbacteria-1 TaxID=2013812 RepID=A0A2N1UPA2_9BACT|nr:MAG: translation initiation factor IF-3 [Candidatus Kuenenbacteria bacterium HGW-Kuenenbacteria-1]
MRTYRNKFAAYKKQKKFYYKNEKIFALEVKLVDEQGEFIGIFPTKEALEMAKERGYDLVEISPKENPPVAKFLNFGQLQYEEQKKRRKEKAKLKTIETKGIRLSLRISQHDLDIKLKQVQKFFEKKHKVKIEMNLKGRERQHADLAMQIIQKFIEQLGEKVVIEQPTARQGGRLFILIKEKE